jgi:CIC family chloride channel protein
MICANNEGVSGGIFVPNLAFGAMIASLISEGLIAAGLVDGQYFAVLIVVGMASFLAAASRTPLTAAIFAAEVLCIASNIIPAICGVVISYIIAEASGKLSFADTVIEARAEAAHRGKKPLIVECKMTVQKSSFADGMEVREILWPPTCTVLSIDKNPVHAAHGDLHCLEAGDVLHLHYRTYDPDHTVKNLISILGEQPKDISASVELGSEEHLVPED